MKVAYLLYKYPKISETFILNEMILMQDKGVEVEVFATENPGENAVHPQVSRIRPATYFPKPRFMRAAADHLFFLARNPIRYFSTLFFLCRTGDCRKVFLLRISDIRRVYDARPDHMHAHFGDIMPNLAMVIRLLTGIPYSFTTHSFDIFRTPVRNYALKSRLAKKHITISRYNRDYLVKEHRVDPSDIRIIHCGVDTDKLRANGRKEEPLLIATVARLHRDKGLDVLIRACAELARRGTRVECRIAGDGPERENLEKLIRETGASSSVRLLGNLTQDRVFELLCRAAVMVLPSRLEGIPVSLMEAMALKVPVISTRVYGIPELIDDGQTGFLVPPDDVAALADKIAALLADAPLRKSFAERAYEKVRSEFDQDTEAGKLLALWKEEVRP